MIGGKPEATGTPQQAGESSAAALTVELAIPETRSEPGGDTVDGTRFAHASEAEMARILDFYAVRWEYEPTTFPILWNLEGDVVESFAPDFYLPDLEMFLEMTTLKQRLVRKKNRKLRRLRELYPGIRIKLFYARDFRAMMLKYGRLGLAESLSGTPGQMLPERPLVAIPLAVPEATAMPAPTPEAPPPIEPASVGDPADATPGARPTHRARPNRRRRHRLRIARAEQETGA